MKYTKPPLRIDDQINLLDKRGMVIPDPQRAARHLSHISYFRLRGYWIPFENDDKGKDHHFKDGTTFDNVLNLYLFDRKFRLLILEAIERVEISFRAHFANELGVAYGSHFLGYFLKLISPGTSWPQRMKLLITQFQGIRPAAMGFQENWKNLSLWHKNR